MKKQLILCADDFGLNHAVNQAVLDLAQRRRISATSVMVTHNPEPALLHQLQSDIYLGLHLNLTEGVMLSSHKPAQGLMPLMIKTALRWPERWIMAECRSQLLRFKDLTGRWPDFIDGHQHVHQFPRVRQALITLADKFRLPDSIWWRATSPMSKASGYVCKKRILTLWGANEWVYLLKSTRKRRNHGFAGIYDFNPKTNYGSLMQTWLTSTPSGGLIMCHPAKGDDAYDKINQARQMEYQYLLSDAFLTDCQQAHVTLWQKPL